MTVSPFISRDLQNICCRPISPVYVSRQLSWDKKGRLGDIKIVLRDIYWGKIHREIYLFLLKKVKANLNLVFA